VCAHRKRIHLDQLSSSSGGDCCSEVKASQQINAAAAQTSDKDNELKNAYETKLLIFSARSHTIFRSPLPLVLSQLVRLMAH
jgi:hypothetical protein